MNESKGGNACALNFFRKRASLQLTSKHTASQAKCETVVKWLNDAGIKTLKWLQ